MKIASFLITAGVNTGLGTVLFLFLIMALNGFTEKQAAPGLILFFVWVLISALLTAVLCMKTARFFTVKKSLSAVWAVLISVLIYIGIGGILNFVGLMAAIALVSILR